MIFEEVYYVLDAYRHRFTPEAILLLAVLDKYGIRLLGPRFQNVVLDLLIDLLVSFGSFRLKI